MYMYICTFFSNPISPVNCAAVLCFQPDCDNPVVPPGQCCAVCPGM